MGTNRTRPRLREHAHCAPLADLRLLLDVELDPLHLRQYDFRRKQPVAERVGGGKCVNRHRISDGEGAIRGADEASQIASDAQALANVPCNRAEIRTAPAA